MKDYIEIFLHIYSRSFILINTFVHKYRFMNFGKKSTIGYRCIFQMPKKISIGNNVTISSDVKINAYDLSEENKSSLNIGDGSFIGRGTHINAYKKVVIEEHVLIGENVYIGDTDHNYDENSELPIIMQGWKCKEPVLLKRGCYISKNAVILPGIIVGKNAIVGPNAVVTMNIPNYALAWGNPARLIKNNNPNE